MFVPITHHAILTVNWSIDTKCDFLRKRLLSGDGRVSHWGVLLKVGALLNIVTLTC